MFAVNRTTRYRNFGYLPRGLFLRDLYGKLFGYPNLTKRLAAREIMSAIDLKPSESVLDFGCGVRGYFTVELAKVAMHATGLDVVPALGQARIPESLAGKLEYKVFDGSRIPFEDDSFDVVLASEVISVSDDPDAFLQEWRRVLKPGGRLVIINGSGREAIKESLDNPGLVLRFLRRVYRKRWPGSFDEYIHHLNEAFGNRVARFYDLADIERMSVANGFETLRTGNVGSGLAHRFIIWKQFLRFLRGRPVLGNVNFVPSYHVFCMLRMFDGDGARNQLVYVATNKK